MAIQSPALRPAPPPANTRRRARKATLAALACVWCGPLLCVGFFIGFVVLAGFVPPTDPSNNAAQIQAVYLHNLTGIRAGMFFMAVAIVLLAPWGTAIAYLLRRATPHLRVLTQAQLVCVGGGTAIGLLIPIVWGVAAYRPGEYPAGTVLMLHDLGWFLFLFSWPLFSVWPILMAAAILMDESPVPVFPRWVAYLSVWVAFAFIADGMIIFFKSGPFSYHGLISFYVATAGFFVWVVALSVLAIRSLRRELREDPARAVDGRTQPA